MTTKEMIAELKGKMEELKALKEALHVKEQEFLAIQKSYLGITDGEKANVLDLFDAIFSRIPS